MPDRLLTPANALEASSFNLALVVGPALAGTLAAAFGPEASLVTEIVLTLAALVPDPRDPGPGPPAVVRGRGGELGLDRRALGPAADRGRAATARR